MGHITNNYHINCNKCGYAYTKGNYPARWKQCINCGKLGHFSKVFRGQWGFSTQVNEVTVHRSSETYNWVKSTNTDEQQYNEDLFIGTVANDNSRIESLWHKKIQIGQNICFKLDTGLEANLIPVNIFKNIQDTPLKPASCHLVTYTGERIIRQQ